MKFDKEIKLDLIFMAVGCGICSALAALVAWLIGELKLPVLLGCIAGWVLTFGNFFFMTVGIIMALETGEEKEAKRRIRNSRIVRTVVMLAVIALTIVFPHHVHYLPVILSMFYPRILITAKGYWDFFRRRNDPVPETVSRTDPEEDDTEESTDGFEKFVEHFSKGNVPGTDSENKK